eukprot:385830-Pleurochrysis_carterae.AAC.3
MQCPCSQPTWCKCKPGASQQHLYPTAELDVTDVEASYTAMINYCEEEELFAAGQTLASSAPAAATSRRVSGCGGGISTLFIIQLSDAEQKAARSKHDEMVISEHEHDRHYYQLLFSHPLPKLGMLHAGVEMLHLVYLNLFKQLFRYTVHDGLPGVCPPPLCYVDVYLLMLNMFAMLVFRFQEITRPRLPAQRRILLRRRSFCGGGGPGEMLHRSRSKEISPGGAPSRALVAAPSCCRGI